RVWAPRDRGSWQPELQSVRKLEGYCRGKGRPRTGWRNRWIRWGSPDWRDRALFRASHRRSRSRSLTMVEEKVVRKRRQKGTYVPKHRQDSFVDFIARDRFRDHRRGVEQSDSPRGYLSSTADLCRRRGQDHRGLRRQGKRRQGDGWRHARTGR